MRFLLVLEEEDGCDYTIGCGIAVHELEFDIEKDATESIFAWLAEEYGDPEDGYIDENLISVRLFVVSGEVEVDLDSYRFQRKAQKAKEEVAAIEKEECAELRRLQRKYGATPKIGL